MLLKDSIRTKICGISQTSCFSLRSFIRWARVLDKPLLIKLLDEIQAELDEEEQYYKKITALVGGGWLQQDLRRQWCLYCVQLRRYYQRPAKQTREKEFGSNRAININ